MCMISNIKSDKDDGQGTGHHQWLAMAGCFPSKSKVITISLLKFQTFGDISTLLLNDQWLGLMSSGMG